MELEDDTTMAQEDQTRNCSNGGGLGRSTSTTNKKPKQKKVPQRGLGVAQLERIRLGEQQKRDVAATILPSPNSVPSSSSISSYLPLPINNFNHSNNHPSSTSPGPPPAEFRHPQVPSNAPLSNNNGSFESAWPVVSVPGHGSVPKLWNSHEFEFDLEKDNFGVEPGLPFLASLPFESNPIWPLPNILQKTPQYHHRPSSPMVNTSSGTSSVHVPHLSIEPPSNQNSSSSGVSVRPVEKVVGMKRPYPFSLDFPHAPAFNYNKLPTYAEISTNAKTSWESESGFQFDAGNSSSREVPSCSASNSEPSSKKRNKGIKDFDGHFLTLATPNPIPCPSTSLAFHNQECPEFESPSCQENNIEDQLHPPPGYRLFNHQKQPLYSFFLPAAKEAKIGQTTAKIQNCHEVGESIDLNLKL